MSKYDPAYRRPMLTIICPCGTPRIIRRSNTGRVALCASCRQAEGRRKSAAVRASTPERKAANDAWSEYRLNARKKGVEFALSREEFVDLRSRPCQYCGKSAPSGVDRVDNNLGYIAGNVAPCCRRCNYAKRDMAVSTFLKWVTTVYEHQSSLQRDRPVLLCLVEQSDGQGAHSPRDDQRQVDRRSNACRGDGL